MNVAISLFQKQSYEDAWQTYQEQLNGGLVWDFVVLTASNEEQAAGYRRQLEHRISKGLLPAKTEFLVFPDPEGKRVGSGGATLHALGELRRRGDFVGRRILMIHSGGDSKRIPQYSACGKLFSPVPRMLPDGRPSTLFDECFVGMGGVASRIEEGMLVCSGDVLLLFNPLQIDFYGRGAAALSIKTPAVQGQHHGVYLADAQGDVGEFLHKQPVELLRAKGAANERDWVDVDTGAVLLHRRMLDSLYALVDTPEKMAAFVNERARISFYGDFLYPLASGSSLEQYLLEKPEGEFTPELEACRRQIWQALLPYSMQLVRLFPASFLHFGTTAELGSLLQKEIFQYKYLDWSRQVGSWGLPRDVAGYNSLACKGSEIGEESYLENSWLGAEAVVGEGCILSHIQAARCRIPSGLAVHGLPLRGGGFVVRIYGIEDNPKEARWLGMDLDRPLWDMPLFPAADSLEAALEASLAAVEAWRLGRPLEGERLSLAHGFARADMEALMAWEERLADEIRIEHLMDVIRAKGDLEEAKALFVNGLSSYGETLLRDRALALRADVLEEFSQKIRIFRFLSKWRRGESGESYRRLCFNTIRDGLLSDGGQPFSPAERPAPGKDRVEVSLPLRVNWGGGWSDTPPYCIENGGTVLNAAISLEGRLPVQVTVEKLPRRVIRLEVEDNGIGEDFTSLALIRDCGNPYDQFALHKAALLACGLLPLEGEADLAALLEGWGFGLRLATKVENVPRGSGLGTSSILAGACIRALCIFLGREISQEALYNRVLCMEQLMSTGGGWQDQVGGLVRGVKMVTSPSGLAQNIHCTNLRINPLTLQELNARFCLIYTGQRRLARNLLREVVGRYVDGRPEMVEVLHEIQRTAVLMRLELEKGRIDRFAHLLNAHWELSKRLDAGSTNTCIEHIFASVQDLIEGKMICGAGGGGFLQVVLKSGVSKEDLAQRLSEVFQDSGVALWDCAIV